MKFAKTITIHEQAKDNQGPDARKRARPDLTEGAGVICDSQTYLTFLLD